MEVRIPAFAGMTGWVGGNDGVGYLTRGNRPPAGGGGLRTRDSENDGGFVETKGIRGINGEGL